MDIVEFVVQYAQIWLPTITSIIGIVLVVLKSCNNIRDAVGKVSNDATNKKMLKVYEDLSKELKCVLTQNDELMKANRELKEMLYGKEDKKN